MKVFRTLFSFYLDASIHVSLAVCAFVWMSCLVFGTEVDFFLLGYIFLGSITGYNFIKYATQAGLHHKSLARHLRAIQLFSLCAFIGFLYFLFQMPLSVLWISAVFGALTLFYIVPFLRSKSLRSLSGLKIYVVALVWSGVTVWLPWSIYAHDLSRDFVLLFAQRFLWVVVLTIPFEIRDLKYDTVALGTLPQVLGIYKAKILGTVLLVLVVGLEFARGMASLDLLWGFVVMWLLTLIGIWASRKDQSVYFSSFWVEAIPIIGALILYLMHYWSIS